MLVALALATLLFPTSPAPQDSSPVWSPDARWIGFRRETEGTRPGAGAFVVPAGHGPTSRRGRGAVLGWRPDMHELATVFGETTTFEPWPKRGVSSRADERLFGWSPDGRRLGFVAGDRILVSQAGREREVATFGPGATWDRGPVWSPDGTRIAFASMDPGGFTSSLEVVNADGTGLHAVFRGPNQNVNPSWAPGGERLAFETNSTGRFRIWTVGADGGDPRPLMAHDFGDDRLPTWNPAGTAIAFVSDREGLEGGATPSQYALYTVEPDGSHVEKLAGDVHPFSPVRFSPTGAQIAFAAGRECQRFGIYTMRPFRGARQRRRTNDCHLDGTPRADTIHGTPYLDVIRGLGGNDHVLGGNGHDLIEGGTGDDVLDGRYGDWILGGPGRDRVSGGPGDDLVRVRDGERDAVECGSGQDTVLADRVDRVARDCEEVFRSHD